MKSPLMDTDLAGIGTSLYRAPEREILDRQGKTDRTVTSIEKIDIYSLGVIAAELWYPMKTNSERVQVCLPVPSSVGFFSSPGERYRS